MPSSILISIIGYCGAVLIALSMIPQVIKNWKEKSAKDISLVRSFIYYFGIFLWTEYAIFIGNIPLTALNLTGFTLGTISLFLKIKYG